MWYYTFEDAVRGPADIHHVRSLLRSGILTVDDYAWGVGMEKFRPIGTIEEILQEPPTPPDEAHPTPDQVPADDPNRGHAAPRYDDRSEEEKAEAERQAILEKQTGSEPKLRPLRDLHPEWDWTEAVLPPIEAYADRYDGSKKGSSPPTVEAQDESARPFDTDENGSLDAKSGG